MSRAVKKLATISPERLSLGWIRYDGQPGTHDGLTVEKRPHYVRAGVCGEREDVCITGIRMGRISIAASLTKPSSSGRSFHIPPDDRLKPTRAQAAKVKQKTWVREGREFTGRYPVLQKT